jgi:hypothetical protein
MACHGLHSPAGCWWPRWRAVPSGAPVDSGPGPVAYNLTNADTTDHTLTLGTVDGPVERLELRYANGTVRSVAAPGPEGAGGPTTGVYELRNVTGVTVDGRSERAAATLPPGRAAPASCPSPRGRRSC